jgi:Type VI secretion system effector, Hcp
MTIDCFLQIPGITGESADRDFAGQVEVLSWKFGATHPGAPHVGPGGPAGRVEVRDFAITRWLDRATPVLIQACCAGRRFANATLTCRRGGPRASPLRASQSRRCLDHLGVAGRLGRRSAVYRGDRSELRQVHHHLHAAEAGRFGGRGRWPTRLGHPSQQSDLICCSWRSILDGRRRRAPQWRSPLSGGDPSGHARPARACRAPNPRSRE